MRREINTAPINGFPTKPPVIISDWSAFCEWAKDAGYDESYLNQWDSKCLALQEQFLAELAENNTTEG